MNDYMTRQLRVLETFISGAGRETGEVSSAMAEQALGILRSEIERDGDLSAALSERAIEVKEQAVPALETSALRQYVTVVEMEAKHVAIPSLDGVGNIILEAHSPKINNVDEMILFGEERAGITNAWATVFINPYQDIPCAYDLSTMVSSIVPISNARWIASTYMLGRLLDMTDETGKRISEEGMPPSIFGFPIIWVDGEMCREHGFKIALADLRYYVWGEYRDGDSLLVDGTVGAGPFASHDGLSVCSPFVVLKRIGEA
jgi:hypothetical protein